MVSENNKSGFAIVDVLIAIAIMAILTPVVLTYMARSSEKTAQRQASDHMREVVEASSIYFRDNYHSLASGGLTQISLNALKTGGYLPTHFRDINAWNQTYEINVWPHSIGGSTELRGLVLTRGGQSRQGRFNSLMVPEAATMIGGQGGFVNPDNPSEVQGSYGGWGLNLDSIGIASPGAGHLAGYVNFSRGEVRNDYLYRVDVPGRPELNQMEVNLDMRGFNVDNVSVVEFDSDPAVDCGIPGQIFYSSTGMGGNPAGFYETVSGECRYMADVRYVTNEIENFRTEIYHTWETVWRNVAKSDAKDMIEGTQFTWAGGASTGSANYEGGGAYVSCPDGYFYRGHGHTDGKTIWGDCQRIGAIVP